MKVSLSKLRIKIKKYVHFLIPTASSKDIIKITNHYLLAEIAGIKTHGLNKLLWDAKDFKDNYKRKSKKIFFRDNLYSFDMNGMIGALGIEQLCDFIKRSGKNLIGVHFSNLSSYGSLFFSAYNLSLKGYSSIIFNNTDKFMSLENGKDLLGTNPICLSFACHPPIIFDIATSKKNISYAFDLINNSKVKAPKYTYLDKNKKYTTSPELIKYVVPMAGYKGFGLSLMIELFSGFFIKNRKLSTNKKFLVSGMIFAFKSSCANLKGANNFINNLTERYPGRDSITNLKLAQRNNLVEISDKVYNSIYSLV
jgi:LDH2 family malate/lactate/ureidoglycolate dehydrogenase